MNPTVNPTRSPSIPPTKSPSVLPTTSPSYSPTVLPSVAPTNYPTQEPTTDCRLFDLQASCRASGCAWNEQMQSCSDSCERFENTIMVGQTIGELQTKNTISECEFECQNTVNCVRYSFYLQYCF